MQSTSLQCSVEVVLFHFTLSVTVPMTGRVAPPYAVILDFVGVTFLSLLFDWNNITLRSSVHLNMQVVPRFQLYSY